MALGKEELARFFVSTNKFFFLKAKQSYTGKGLCEDFIQFISDDASLPSDTWVAEEIQRLYIKPDAITVQFPSEIIESEMWQKFMSEDEKAVLRVLCGLVKPGTGMYIGQTMEICEYVGCGQKYVLSQIKQLKWRNLILDKHSHKSFLVLRLHSMFNDAKVSVA